MQKKYISALSVCHHLPTTMVVKKSLTHAELLTLHVPTPFPHPTDSVEVIKAKFLRSFNIALGGEEGGVMDFENESILFITLLVIHID